MGYETLCYALYDQRDLVQAIADRSLAIDSQVTRRLLEFDCVKMILGSDDMGFRSGTFIGPKDTRALVLPGHKALARLTHDAGRLYLLHSCGNLAPIMDNLIDDVKIDGKHSRDDIIRDARDAKRLWGNHIAVLGGIDMEQGAGPVKPSFFDRLNLTAQGRQPGKKPINWGGPYERFTGESRSAR